MHITVNCLNISKKLPDPINNHLIMETIYKNWTVVWWSSLWTAFFGVLYRERNGNTRFKCTTKCIQTFLF